MNAREAILGRVRTALDRRQGQAVPDLGPPRLTIPDIDVATRIALFSAALEKLSGSTFVAESREQAHEYVMSVVAGRTTVTSRSSLIQECGLANIVTQDQHRSACADVAVGITGAEYGLADTGTLVVFSGTAEGRLMSLLPPVHIALLERGRLLTGLDELLTTVPLPARNTSAMVMITGPSRTADIEQILVRGVHGPGELYVVIV
jgi:L-lactate dehydrogenase complex protein LldG